MDDDTVTVTLRRRRPQRSPKEIDAEYLKLVLAEIENHQRGDQTAEETLAYITETTSRWLHEHYVRRLRQQRHKPGT